MQIIRTKLSEIQSRGWLKLIGMLVTVLALTACGTLPHKAVPEKLADVAELPGLSGIRYWGDEAPSDLKDFSTVVTAQLRTRFADDLQSGKTIQLESLALSGGGEDGAFGVGLLLGWTERGDRPEFQFVTGISVGALIAPFAFLGPHYDGKLKELLLAIPQDAEMDPEALSVLFGISLLDGNPLAQPIQRFITRQMLEEIAIEHRKGRRLMISTTNLDAGRPVVWDIGALANSGHPKSLEILQKIILASASIPGIFRPVLFDVEAGGRRYDELHVDGGVTAQVFLYPAQVQLDEVFAELPIEGRLYVIRNRKQKSNYQDKIAGLFSITARSLDTLIRNQGNGDLYQIYLITQRDKIDFNLAFIPESFEAQSNDLFDGAYMEALFEVGYDLGKAGYPWSKTPPGINGPDG
ncbi:MAG: patatin-like phospholipase family protein [Proteobacteria bacterium]|nr:patatin-like phospholipase family protein [Pseudomonadota bacterium]